jgi:hypothetical protein
VAEGELHSLNGRLRAKGLPLVKVGLKPEKQWLGRAMFRLVNRMGWGA